jgi:hypothetical protein
MEGGMNLGRVTRCSMQGFSGAYPLQSGMIPTFGAFCAAPYQGGGHAVGVIYDIYIEDDPLARQLASLDDVPNEQILDSQKNRQVPVEFNVLTLGHHDGHQARQTMPPQPPLTLEPIHLLAEADLLTFTEDYRFLHAIAMTESLPVDDLMIACVHEALAARPESGRKRYLLGAGRMIARILAGDLHRLEQILRTLSLSIPGETTG